LLVGLRGHVEPELAVERKRPGHVLDDDADEIQLSIHAEDHRQHAAPPS
jgi:hypothetical protein